MLQFDGGQPRTRHDQLQVLTCVHRGPLSSVYRAQSSCGGRLQALKVVPCPGLERPSTDSRGGKRLPDWGNELCVYQRLASCKRLDADCPLIMHPNIRPLLAHWFLQPGDDNAVAYPVDSCSVRVAQRTCSSWERVIGCRSLCMIFPWLPSSLADLLHLVQLTDTDEHAGTPSPSRLTGLKSDARPARANEQSPETFPATAAGDPPPTLVQLLRTDTGKWQCIQMLLSALQFLHQQHIVHRDIKPSNLLVDDQGVLQVADFGLARHLPADDLSSSAGTRQYRAPEMLFGSRNYDCKVDMWACGCVCFEILSEGRVLFDCAMDSDVAQLALIVSVLGDPLTGGRGWPQLRLLPDYGKILFATPTPSSPHTDIAALLSTQSAQDHKCLEDDTAVQLLDQLMVYNPEHRSSAQTALQWVQGKLP